MNKKLLNHAATYLREEVGRVLNMANICDCAIGELVALDEFDELRDARAYNYETVAARTFGISRAQAKHIFGCESYDNLLVHSCEVASRIEALTTEPAP